MKKYLIDILIVINVVVMGWFLYTVLIALSGTKPAVKSVLNVRYKTLNSCEALVLTKNIGPICLRNGVH